jgi:anaerobic selenocysteine-containing dehydrogenase
MPVFTTACPRNCYSTCALRVTVEDNRITAIDASPENRATPGGPCLKGLSYAERVHGPDRLRHPLRRQSNGGFRPISWDEALDTLAEQLSAVKSRYGPQAVMHYAGSGTKGLLNGVSLAFWRLFGGCTTTYGDLCWPAGLEATRLTLGDNVHNAPWDLANAKLILLWGRNAAETNLHQMAFVQEALDRGASLVVIDPRRTETAERATLLVQPRPGTDGALALALAHELFRNGWVDEAFLDAHAIGWEAYRERVAAWTPERAAEITGVDPGTLRGLAHRVGTLFPMTLVPGFGMQRYTNSGQTMRALLALCVLTGNLGRPGAGWQYANLQTDIFGSLRDPLDSYPPEQPDGVVRVSLSTARLGPDMLAQRDPPLKFAWVERGNPIPQNPQTQTVLQAFRALDFRVVVDERMTDTAREADLVLPSKSLFEQTDVIGAYWHPYLQLRRKVLAPPGEVRPETEIFWQLARRLGLDPAPNLPAPDETEAWLGARLAPQGLSLASFDAGPVLSPAFQEVAWEDLRFPTPSGRIELFSEEARSRWGVDPLPDYTPPMEMPGGATPLQLLTPNTKNGIHSQFLHLKALREIEPGPVLVLNPEDAEARGLAEGRMARVFNARGELRLPVRVDFGLRKGCVCVVNGWGLAEGAVNLLSAARETDMGHGAAFHDNAVEVAALRPGD